MNKERNAILRSVFFVCVCRISKREKEFRFLVSTLQCDANDSVIKNATGKRFSMAVVMEKGERERERLFVRCSCP